MPELPEVETVRRGLALKMSGRRILQAELRRPDLRRPFPPALAARLDGARIGALGRRGKYILIELDADGVLLLHLGMSGRVTAGSAALPDAPHDHVVLRLDDGTVIRFNDARIGIFHSPNHAGEARRRHLQTGCTVMRRKLASCVDRELRAIPIRILFVSGEQHPKLVHPFDDVVHENASAVLQLPVAPGKFMN